jgi:hypothetical protein
MSPIILTPNRVIQVKSNPVLVSNLLELKSIEKYHCQHPDMSMNDAAIQWIDKNAAKWRAKHPMEVINGTSQA